MLSLQIYNSFKLSVVKQSIDTDTSSSLDELMCTWSIWREVNLEDTHEDRALKVCHHSVLFVMSLPSPDLEA